MWRAGLVIFFAALTMFLFQSVPTLAGTADGLLGDANCSGNVDPVDSLTVLRHDAGISAAPCVDLADVQCDGDVDVIDSLQVLRWDSGLSTVQGPGCPAIGEPLGPGPTSLDLINTALDAGELTPEEALTYRVFAVFGDDRLPAEYRGDDGGEFDGTGTVGELAAVFDTLGPETQETLAPFLRYWEEPDSWFNQRLAALGTAGLPPPGTALETIDGSPHVRVYYRLDRPADAALAESIANEIDTIIWPKLTSLMGEPVDDSTRVPNGGDGRLDILLSGLPNRAFARSDPGCQASSGYLVLGQGYTDKEVVAHEVMHAILFRYAVADQCQSPGYDWVHEATAQWAIDHVYPQSQLEWGSKTRPTAALACFLDKTNQSLETENDCHEYGAYLFLFYLARFNSPQYVRLIWDSYAFGDSLDGINAAIAPLGGLKDIWPKFEMYNYNREPRIDYKTKDSIALYAALEAEENVTLGGAATNTYVLRGDADHLAAFFHEYTFSDSDIRYVKFTHKLSDDQTAYVRALIKYEGDSVWKDEDWTPEEEREFCYDDAGQKKIEKLVIIISNSEFQNRSHVLTSSPQPELEVRSSCTLEGTATGEYHDDQENQHEDWMVTADIEWVEDPDFLFGCNCRVFFPEGDIYWQWEFSYDEPPCDDFESGHLVAAKQPSPYHAEQMLILWDHATDPGLYSYSGDGMINMTWFSECENGERCCLTYFHVSPPEEISTATPTFPFQGVPAAAPAGTTSECNSGQFTIPKNATSIEGSCLDSGGTLYKWNFSLVKDP